MASAPPLWSARLVRTRIGVPAPPGASSNRFVAPLGAPTTRLLTVSVVGKALAVPASMLTVLLPALVMETAVCPKYGGPFSDQLPPFSHFPLLRLVQLLAPPTGVTMSAGENSVSPLPVAVRKRPGAS